MAISGGQHVQLLQLFRKVIPSLAFDTYKGQQGRIGIVGGCEEYTGAPIFASMAAFRTGADLVHVFCTKNAAIPIKSFSPDLIVHPILDLSSFSDEMDKWLPRLHALVIGPGLGRDHQVLSNVEALIKNLRQREIKIPLVVDADGLYLITEKPELIKNYQHCILTPNAVEFERLYDKLMPSKPDDPHRLPKDSKKLADQLHVNIFRKGRIDEFCSPNTINTLRCEVNGSPRRCGGQGDLLAGTLGLCYYWTLRNHARAQMSDRLAALDASQIASYAASTLIRTSANTVFNRLGRSMISADILKEIGSTFHQLFESENNN